MEADERFAEMRHMERELVRVDDAALLAVDDAVLAERLREHRAEHLRHAEEIEEYLRSLGEPMPAVSEAFRRRTEERVREVAAAVDPLEAARVVMDAETDATLRYAADLRAGLPPEAEAFLERHLAEEQRHVADLERFAAVEVLPGQGHGGAAYNDTGGEMGTGPGVGGRHGHREE